jgi:proline dehydrogenase
MKILNKMIGSSLPIVPKSIVRSFASHYIAGEDLNDAVMVVKKLMADGARATLDILGEEIIEREKATAVVDEYKTVLQAINSNNLTSTISVKPTHIGLKIDKEFCYDNMVQLLQEAKKFGNFVRIDMEDHTCTTDTIQLYKRLLKDFDNVGTVLQAYLRRTINDINEFLPIKPNLRICKGIYVEPREIAYKDAFIINRNFAYAVEKLLAEGCFVGIATHDEKLVWEVLKIIDHHKISRDQYEFQMLLGVEPQLKQIILQGGYPLQIYVPFGKEWYAYSLRRLKESPDVTGHVMRSTLRRMLRLEI